MTSTDMVLVGSYDYLLVALSATIAILASYAALRSGWKGNCRAG